MKKFLIGLALLLAFIVPIFINLHNGQQAGRFWDGEDGCYVYRGQAEYDSAVFNRRLLLVALPCLFGLACFKNRRPG